MKVFRWRLAALASAGLTLTAGVAQAEVERVTVRLDEARCFS